MQRSRWEGEGETDAADRGWAVTSNAKAGYSELEEEEAACEKVR